MTLKAKLPVLYGSKQYRPGDALPATNTALVEAWLASGAAYWDEAESQGEAPKAKTVALAGTVAKSSDGDPEAQPGKVPKRGRGKR